MKKNQEKIELSEKDFSFVCPLKTTDMTEVEGGYHCDSCNEKVHDVTNMTKDEYHNLVDKDENICIVFSKVATMSLALSLTAVATPNKENRTILGKGEVNNNTISDTNNSCKSLENNNTTKRRILMGKRVVSKRNHGSHAKQKFSVEKVPTIKVP